MNDNIAPEITASPVSEVVAEASDKVSIAWDVLFPYIKDVGIAILILVVGLITIGIIKRSLKKICRKSPKIDRALESFLVSGTDIVLKILVFIVILTTLGVETTSIVAILGAASLAIGIALQGALSNFAAGVMLMVFKPYKADDFVKLDEYSGNIYDVNIFATQLKTIDNKIVTIPNSKMMNGPLVNFSTSKLRRVDITVGVDYESDIEKVKMILMDLMLNHPKILKEPKPLARVIELNESSIDFTIRAWIEGKDYWDVRFDLNEGIKKVLDENKISIPYPHLTLIEKK